jgi:hypothetical protein
MGSRGRIYPGTERPGRETQYSPPVHTPTSHFLKIHISIILTSTPGSSKLSLSLRFHHQIPVHASSLPHPSYMSCLSHSSRFNHSSNIGWEVQIMELIM